MTTSIGSFLRTRAWWAAVAHVDCGGGCRDLANVGARIHVMFGLVASLILAAAPIPNFAPAPGWHIARHAAGHPAPCGAFAVAATIKSELPRPGECASLQSRNQNALRGENIVITAWVFGRQRWRKYPARRLPLRLERAPIHHCFEASRVNLRIRSVWRACTAGISMSLSSTVGRRLPTP